MKTIIFTSILALSTYAFAGKTDPSANTKNVKQVKAPQSSNSAYSECLDDGRLSAYSCCLDHSPAGVDCSSLKGSVNQ